MGSGTRLVFIFEIGVTMRVRNGGRDGGFRMGSRLRSGFRMGGGAGFGMALGSRFRDQVRFWDEVGGLVLRWGWMGDKTA